MLLTITTTHQPASDLGYLLHKHPAKVQAFKLAFGTAHIFYPEATDEICTAAMLLDIDSVTLARDSHIENFALKQYVNDRPYVASSFLSVAIATVYSTALAGRCKTHPELVETAIPLTAKISVVASRGGAQLLHDLFEPLGYELTLIPYLLDEQFPEWGASNYFSIELSQTVRLSDLLSHLYVLMPVLDNEKHYYVDEKEIDKLLHHGEGWLGNHPHKELITARYLKHQRSLKLEALRRLISEEDEITEADDTPEEEVEKKIRLHDQRLGSVFAVLKNSGAKRILDLGCGSGKLTRLLLKENQFTEIVAMDVSHRELEKAYQRLKLERLAPRQRTRIQLIHSSLIYRDARLNGYDAAAIVEVIEHLDMPRLRAFERNLFEFMRPTLVVITTPNSEYNVMWETLPTGKFRHHDHRFEWTRAEFQEWATHLCEKYGYQVRFLPIGEVDDNVGSPSQMAIFEINNLAETE